MGNLDSRNRSAKLRFKSSHSRISPLRISHHRPLGPQRNPWHSQAVLERDEQAVAPPRKRKK